MIFNKGDNLVGSKLKNGIDSSCKKCGHTLNDHCISLVQPNIIHHCHAMVEVIKHTEYRECNCTQLEVDEL
jgi:hypothetical protein